MHDVSYIIYHQLIKNNQTSQKRHKLKLKINNYSKYVCLHKINKFPEVIPSLNLIKGYI